MKNESTDRTKQNLRLPEEAHQRSIAEQFREEEPRERLLSLDGYSVETISREDALPLILKYEWLGTLGKSVYFVGLMSPFRMSKEREYKRELLGVACFGYGPSEGIRKLIGEPALCLERGACVHWAPPNAASYLINRACKLIYYMTGIARFFAYGDPSAGEYGGVYQASGWLYLGQGLDGSQGRVNRAGKVYVGRKIRRFVLPPGLDPDVPTNWKTTRILRRSGNRKWDEKKKEWRGMTYKEAEDEGWRLSWRGGKHVYATHVGHNVKIDQFESAWEIAICGQAMPLDNHRRWRREMQSKSFPYPTPRPELKRKSNPGRGKPIRLTKPPIIQSEMFARKEVAP